MVVIERHRDRSCGYCHMSEYKDGYDDRRFFDIQSDGYPRQIIQICEICASKLAKMLVIALEKD